MEIMYISSILKAHNEVFYTRNKDDEKIRDADFIILPSSIIAHETEVQTLEFLKNKRVFVTGIFLQYIKRKISILKYCYSKK